MVVEIEGGVWLPRGRAEGEDGLDDALTEAGHEAAAPFVRLPQPAPVRCPVEQLERHNGRRQPRMALGAPHHRLEVVHARRLRPVGDRGPVTAVRRSLLSAAHLWAIAGGWLR